MDPARLRADCCAHGADEHHRAEPAVLGLECLTTISGTWAADWGKLLTKRTSVPNLQLLYHKMLALKSSFFDKKRQVAVTSARISIAANVGDIDEKTAPQD